MAWHPFRNVGLKIAALILGVLVWLTVSGPQVERDIPRVPVVYRNLPAHLQITDQTEAVNVHVRGVDSLVSQLQAGNDLRVEVDLGNQPAGTLVLPLRVDQVLAPMGVEVRQVDPGTVTLTLEKSGVIDLPVRPTIEGDPAPGYVIGDVTVDPGSVAVVGPERRLQATSFAVTERVLIDGATEPVTQMVSAGVLDAELRLREPRLIRVVVRIEAAGERTLPAVRIVPRNLGAGLRFAAQPEAVSVTVRGSTPSLATLDGVALDAFVDVSRLQRGTHRLPVSVDPGGRLTVTNIDPALVTVIIR
jgi:YbbR domain-containing protein